MRRGAGAVGGRQVHRQVAQPPGAGGEQVFLRGGGAPLGQADAAAGAQVDQVGEPFGAGLGHLAGVFWKACPQPSSSRFPAPT